MRSLSPFDLVSSGSSIVDSSMILELSIKHVLVLSDRAMIKQPRIVAQGPVINDNTKWERAGCGLVCFIFFFFFVCLFVLFLRKYIDRIAE